MSKSKVVAIDQPDVFPWLGTFNKIHRADCFIFYDSCRKDSKLGWTKRVGILQGGKRVWLGFSVAKVHKDSEGRYPKLSEHQFADFRADRERHLPLLYTIYRRAPFFEDTMEIIRGLYEYETGSLCAFNEYCIRSLSVLLGISADFYLASELGVSTSKNEGNADLCLAVGGQTYLSGDGSSEYLDSTVYEDRGIGLVTQRFEHPVYSQGCGDGFVAGLSIIDAMMNLGVRGTASVVTRPDVYV